MLVFQKIMLTGQSERRRNVSILSFARPLYCYYRNIGVVYNGSVAALMRSEYIRIIIIIRVRNNCEALPAGRSQPSAHTICFFFPFRCTPLDPLSTAFQLRIILYRTHDSQLQKVRCKHWRLNNRDSEREHSQLSFSDSSCPPQPSRLAGSMT